MKYVNTANKAQLKRSIDNLRNNDISMLSILGCQLVTDVYLGKNPEYSSEVASLSYALIYALFAKLSSNGDESRAVALLNKYGINPYGLDDLGFW